MGTLRKAVGVAGDGLSDSQPCTNLLLSFVVSYLIQKSKDLTFTTYISHIYEYSFQLSPCRPSLVVVRPECLMISLRESSFRILKRRILVLGVELVLYF